MEAGNSTQGTTTFIWPGGVQGTTTFIWRGGVQGTTTFIWRGGVMGSALGDRSRHTKPTHTWVNAHQTNSHLGQGTPNQLTLGSRHTKPTHTWVTAHQTNSHLGQGTPNQLTLGVKSPEIWSSHPNM